MIPPSSVRYEETLAEITRLDVQLQTLETCSHNKLGEFARPLAIKVAGAWRVDTSTLAPTHVSIGHLYDASGMTLYERFLRAHMRLVALSALVYGADSVAVVRATLQLATSYLRAGLWKQCAEHAQAADALLQRLTPPASQRTESISTRQMDGQLQAAFALFRALDVNGDGAVSRHELLTALATNDFFTQLRAKAHTLPNAFGALLDPTQLESVFRAVDADKSGSIQWREVFRYLHGHDKAFQGYCAQLERTLPPTLVTALRQAYQRVESHATRSRIADALALEGDRPMSSVADYLRRNDDADDEGVVTWPEVLEIACRSQHASVFASLRPRIDLLLGRQAPGFNRRGQIEDATACLRKAVDGAQLTLGPEHPAMVEYYVALSDVLVLRHTQALQVAKDVAAARFDKWLATPEGAQRIRAEAIARLHDANEAKEKLPTKRDAEADARRYLQSLHDRREAQRKPESTPFLDEATELCTKVWSMEQTQYGNEHVHAAIALAGLGNVYIVRDDPTTAVTYFLQAIAAFEAACHGGVPAAAFLRMHVAKVYVHMKKTAEAMDLLQDAATFFTEHAAKFLDADTTRRDCAANAMDAWQGWLDLAAYESPDVVHGVYVGIVEAATIGYGEFSLEVADAQTNLGHYLLKQRRELHGDGEVALEAACYILQVHHGLHDKRVRRLKQEVLAAAAKRKHGDDSPESHDTSWLM
ncbi:hypothetical protein SPRG_09975 [Saprolegnia parasitica CBS 223.65]|uniref:EF-hand domain-containing protein n=1 Tax=Saprolegnia parasitica (strain CBS 223.65) TaxID=695850 RepID=A0A067C8R7_SAPPC|nr:hypothetical protein SPRG_09975 [Saprolegnia parasitica CBS 223.65]KDO23167.1 hypothetical protein SPRG_09975 [Saprolegnia parasitica CBS 223.65]|eukprot:XP_012206119.1 hypothetical protein SPRG_09975 [Saprolegnia parasitica CBS 223.65]